MTRMGVKLSDLINPEAEARLRAAVGDTKAKPKDDSSSTSRSSSSSQDDDRDYSRDKIGQFSSSGGSSGDRQGHSEGYRGRADGHSNGYRAGWKPDEERDHSRGWKGEHTVKSGDTLSAIAERYLGDASRWPEIAKASGLPDDFDPKTLKPGTKLVVPDQKPGTKADDGDLELKDAATPAGDLEHKSESPGAVQVLETDDNSGRVVALVSVTGVEDRVKDVIEPGAYTKTLAKHEPIGVWSHDDKVWVARTESARELLPGDPLFRDLKTMDGQPWPAAAGAVLVESLFNLETQHGRDAYSDVKFFKGKTGWSIGYRATKAHRNPRTGVRSIKELDWFEYSPVMVGAASQPMTLSVKSLAGAYAVDPDSSGSLADEHMLAALEPAELARHAELKASLGLEHKAAGVRRVRTPAGAARYGAPIGSVIVSRKVNAAKIKVGDVIDGELAGRPAKGKVTKNTADGPSQNITVQGDDDKSQVYKVAANEEVEVTRAEGAAEGPISNSQLQKLYGEATTPEQRDLIREALKKPESERAAFLAAGRSGGTTSPAKPKTDAELQAMSADALDAERTRLLKAGDSQGASRVGAVLNEKNKANRDAERAQGASGAVGRVSDDKLATMASSGTDAEKAAATKEQARRREFAADLKGKSDAELAAMLGSGGSVTDMSMVRAERARLAAGGSGAAKPAASTSDAGSSGFPSTTDQRRVRAASKADGLTAGQRASFRDLADEMSSNEHTLAEVGEKLRKWREAAPNDGPFNDAIEALLKKIGKATRSRKDLFDQAKLAHLNGRRRAAGEFELDALPLSVKGVDLSECDDFLLAAFIDADPTVEVKGSTASLNRSPRSNWVEKAGELPAYVREIARGVEKNGKDLDAAIPIAIARIKMLAAKGNPKAIKALAEWEALKAKNGKKYDSDLLEHLESKAVALLEQIDAAYGFLYEAGEFKADDADDADELAALELDDTPADVDVLAEFDAIDAKTDLGLETKNLEAATLDPAELMRAAELRRSLLGT